MSVRTVCTFKASESILEQMQKIMLNWKIDRTSVIKLGLYMIAAYASREEVRQLNAFELVERIEAMAPEEFMSFGDFAE